MNKRGKRKSKSNLLKQIISKNNLIKWIIIGVLVLVILFVIFKVFTGHVVSSTNQTDLGSLVVLSNPIGAQLIVDSIVVGVTPYTVTNLSVGNHLIQVRKDGWNNYEITKYIYNGSNTLTAILTPTTDATPCTDTDGGLNYYVKGWTNGNLDCCSKDYSSSNLMEYYCGTNGELFNTGYLCPNGCANGACINSSITPTSQFCTDTDGGLNYNAKGTVTGFISDLLGNGSCTDFCLPDKMVEEYFCYGPSIGNIPAYSCPTGYTCNEGACVNSSTVAPPNCTDSDNMNYYVKGTVTTIKDGVSSEVTDYCNYYNQSNALAEYYCGPSDTARIFSYSCPNGCVNGACINSSTNQTNLGSLAVLSNPIGAQLIVDSIAVGVTPYTVTNLSVGNHLIQLRKEGWNNYEITKYIYSGSNTLGAILTPPTNTIPCTDTDRGINYYVKGLTNSSLGYQPDYCVNYSSYNLMEYYCGTNGELFNTGYLCPNGCKEGACINVTFASPTESEITAPTTTEDNTLVCTSGCLFVKSCLPYGYRTAISYCNIDNTLIKQVSEGSCINNFECTSNVCVDGQCTTPGLFLRIINWFKTLFGVK